jgi:hypothetical protein
MIETILKHYKSDEKFLENLVRDNSHQDGVITVLGIRTVAVEQTLNER